MGPRPAIDTRAVVLAAALAAVAPGTLAQAPQAQPAPPPVPPSLVDNGFFRPYPYPSLQSPMPAQAGQPDPFLSQPRAEPFPHWATQPVPVPSPNYVPQAATTPAPPAAVPVEPYSAVTSPEAPGNQAAGATTIAPNGQAQGSVASAPNPVARPMPPAPAPAVPATALEQVERQMDRVEQENEEAARTAPVDTTAGFTGTTSERNR
jgi:hypothetical protein